MSDRFIEKKEMSPLLISVICGHFQSLNIQEFCARIFSNSQLVIHQAALQYNIAAKL